MILFTIGPLRKIQMFLHLLYFFDKDPQNFYQPLLAFQNMVVMVDKNFIHYGPNKYLILAYNKKIQTKLLKFSSHYGPTTKNPKVFHPLWPMAKIPSFSSTINGVLDKINLLHLLTKGLLDKNL